MTTYFTGNPIGSVDVKDLYDNAQNLDIAMQTPETTWVDRLGVTRRSWAGATGYDLLGDYAAGIEVTSFNQIIRDPVSGEFWRVSAGTTLPYVTTGAGMPEGGAFVSVGDAVLREQLADDDPSFGAALVSRSLVTVSDVTALASIKPLPGQVYSVAGYYPGTTVGGGLFFWTDSVTPLDDGGLYFAGPGGYWTRIDGRRSIANYGGDPSGTTGSADALERLIEALPEVQETGVNKNIYVDGVFVIERGIQSLSFEKPWGSTFIGSSRYESQIRYSGTETYCLDLPSSEIIFKDVGIYNDSGAQDKTFLKTGPLDGRADNDIAFYRCLATGWNYVHHCFGRGSSNYDCIFGGSQGWSLIESPDPFSEGPFPGNQSIKTGMRRYVSDGMMIDSAGCVFEFSPNGPAANWINEVTVTGVNGNGLVNVIRGGYIRNLMIKTGALVNSFGNNYMVDCRAVLRANIDVNARTQYNPDIVSTVGINGVINSEPGLDTVLGVGDVSISGVIDRLRISLVRSAGRIGNVCATNLVLPEAYRDSPSLGTSFFIQGSGIWSPDSKILIDDVLMSAESFPSSAFQWVSSGISLSSLIVGRTATGVIPAPVYLKKGAAVVPNGSNNVVVTHGLNRTPASSEIQLTPTTNPTSLGFWWVSAINATSFTIACSNTASAAVGFAWSV